MSYEKWSIGYFFVKGYVKFAHRLVHKKIVATGLQKLPRNKPVIFAPNHQNALCDPLSVLFSVPFQLVWLARADIFNKKAARAILRFFKIMPVYRIRDGKENLGKNGQTFSDSINVLRNNCALALFPEGAHNFRRQMIAHKKAVPRIVFMAEENCGNNLDIQVVPVGIYYSHYWKFNRTLIVNIGDPVAVKEFLPLYSENQHLATLALKDRIYEAILPLVINIGSERFYNEFEEIRKLYGRFYLRQKGIKYSTLNLFKAGQEIVGELDRIEKDHPEETEKICAEVSDYLGHVKKLKLRDWLVDPAQDSFLKFFMNLLILAAGLPVCFYGAALNILPFGFLDRIVRKKVKKEVFWSSFFFAGGIILFPLVYLIEMILFSLLSQGIWINLLFLISLPVTGKLAFRWYTLLLKTLGRFRLIRIKTQRKEVFDSLFAQKKNILESLERLIPVSKKF